MMDPDRSAAVADQAAFHPKRLQRLNSPYPFLENTFAVVGIETPVPEPGLSPFLDGIAEQSFCGGGDEAALERDRIGLPHHRIDDVEELRVQVRSRLFRDSLDGQGYLGTPKVQSGRLHIQEERKDHACLWRPWIRCGRISLRDGLREIPLLGGGIHLLRPQNCGRAFGEGSVELLPRRREGVYRDWAWSRSIPASFSPSRRSSRRSRSAACRERTSSKGKESRDPMALRFL